MDRLQSEHDGQPAGGDGQSGGGVGVALQRLKRKTRESQVADRDAERHCTEGADCEYADHQHERPPVSLGGGVHELRNQRLAGSEDEKGKQHPRRNRCRFVVGGVYVGVVVGVGVRVVMDRAVGVYVEVPVRFVADGPLHAPDGIGQPESEHQPGGDVTAGRFEGVQPADGHPGGDANRTQDERAEYVTQASVSASVRGSDQWRARAMAMNGT